LSYEQYRPGGFRVLPEVVKNLLIINGIMFLLSMMLDAKFGIDLNHELGLHMPGGNDFRPWQLITYMFMHGSFQHIFFNMFALWMFGSAMENYWTPGRFLIYYLITGIGAGTIQWLVFYLDQKVVLDALSAYCEHPGMDSFKALIEQGNIQIVAGTEAETYFHDFVSRYDGLMSAGNPKQALQVTVDFVEWYKGYLLNLPVVVGASGAVFGLLLAYGMTFPNTTIYLYFAIPIKAKYFVILYGVLELFMGLRDSGEDNVAHFAHLGGMLFGFLLILYWKKKHRYY
jgi:membrane associated rhomboid family serine protease